MRIEMCMSMRKPLRGNDVVESKAAEAIVDELEIQVLVKHATDAVAIFRHCSFAKRRRKHDRLWECGSYVVQHARTENYRLNGYTRRRIISRYNVYLVSLSES